jgi:quinol-cytochrome oxidoreductase complex cytochrome b subunit
MAKKSGSDKNYISVWQWFLLFFLFAIPCIGLGVLIALAFVGENESRKNYCRAVLFMLLLCFLACFCLNVLGFLPEITAALQKWLQQHHWHV